jgi:CYTH domain-containing protein
VFEIEYKYLLTSLPDAFLSPDARVLEIWQFYTPGTLLSERFAKYQYHGDPGPTYVRTVKYPVQGAKRIELEEQLDAKTFEFFLNCCVSAVRKTRYKLRLEDGNIWEVDVFHDRDQPLFIAELEVETDGPVTVPATLVPYVIKEITLDPQYKSEVLATTLRRVSYD